MVGDSKNSSHIGRLLNERYLLTLEFAQSSLAWMFKASDVNLRREVAVKMLRPHLLDDKEFLEHFESRAKRAAQLNHANIAAFYNWGVDESPYIVTELCRGENLAKMIEACREAGSQGKNVRGAIFVGGLNISQIISIGKQAAEGLAHAHSKGFIHKNITPANILFDLGGNVKLSDFEISSMFENKAPPSISESLLGDGFYSAPEELGIELEGQIPQVSEKVDIFSLGLILLELSLGIAPFDKSLKIDAYIERLYDQIQIPQELGELGDILSLALKANPAERPSATELVWHLNGIPTQAQENASVPLEISKAMLSKSKVNWKKYARAATSRQNSVQELPSQKQQKQQKQQEQEADILKEKIHTKIQEKIESEDFLHLDPVEISKSSKISKVGLIAAILSLLAVSITTTISVNNRFGNNLGTKNLISVPNVVGLTQTEAVQMLEDFWEVRILRLHVEDVEEGKVAATNPEPEESLKRGEVISITTSLGEPLVLLPASLLGVNLETVVPRLAGIGLGLGQIYRRQGERLIPVEISEANFAQDILVGFNEPIGEVEWGSEVSLIVIKP